MGIGGSPWVWGQLSQIARVSKTRTIRGRPIRLMLMITCTWWAEGQLLVLLLHVSAYCAMQGGVRLLGGRDPFLASAELKLGPLVVWMKTVPIRSHVCMLILLCLSVCLSPCCWLRMYALSCCSTPTPTCCQARRQEGHVHTLWNWKQAPNYMLSFITCLWSWCLFTAIEV